MSIQAAAGSTYLITVDRPEVNPPIIFPGVGLGNYSTHSVWVFPTNNIPQTLSYYVGSNGSQLVVSHDGENWSISGRIGSVVVFNRIFAPVTLNKWSVFAIVIGEYQFTIYAATENPDDPNVANTPVHMIGVTNFGYPIDFTFHYFNLLASSNLVICNFKFWNTTLTGEQLDAQVNRWDATNGGNGPAPFWASPLRTQGDLSNIVNPRAGADWALRHGFYQINTPENLITQGDPQYMATHTASPTWLYPLPIRGYPRLAYYPTVAGYHVMSHNPGTVPAVRTTYNASQLWDIEDRGSIPPTSRIVSLISKKYYGVPSSLPPGVVNSDTWALYRDENAVDFPGEMIGNPVYRFEGNLDNGVPLIANITPDNMYIWKYGAQFTWQGGASVPTATALLSFPFLLITYIGYPTGVPGTAYVDTAGIFAINKGGPSHDKYNRGMVLKIPDPTIRTAFIGE